MNNLRYFDSIFYSINSTRLLHGQSFSLEEGEFILAKIGIAAVLQMQQKHGFLSILSRVHARQYKILTALVLL